MPSEQRLNRAPAEVAAPILTIRLLGGFSVVREHPGAVSDKWRRPSARTIVKLLALARGHRMTRDEVMHICWPDVDPEAARSSLRVALHAVRHALEPERRPRAPSSYLLGDGDLLLLSPDTVEVDVECVEREAAAALDAEDADGLSRVSEALTAELLPEDRYTEWVEPHRRELARLRRQLGLKLAEVQMASGQPGAATIPLERLLAGDESDEELSRALIGAYAAAGQPRRAAERYRRLRTVLSEELGTTPAAETDELYRTLLGEGRSGVSGLVAGGPAPSPALPVSIRRAPDTPLRGRDRALADLLEGLPGEDADLGAESSGLLTLVSGEIGIGKTRLVAEAARKVAAGGSVILWGAAYEAEGPLPYGPFADALASWFAGRDPGERAAAVASHPELADLLPGSGAAPAVSPATDEERARLFRAFRSLLIDIAGPFPMLVVLDDLHFADLGTLRLLHHLVRTAHDARVQFVATYREDDVATTGVPEWRTLLAALTRQGRSRRVELMRLPRADCDRVVLDIARTEAYRSHGGPRPFKQETLTNVYELSRGNPLFAVEIVRSLQQQSPDLREHEIAPPETVRELVAARLALASPPAQGLLGVLAAAGGAISTVEVADVAADGLNPGLREPALSDEIDDLVASHDVEECDVVLAGRRVPGLTFRHPVIGLAVYDQLGSSRRRRLHQALAGAVRQHRPEAVDALAHHLDRAGDPAAALWLRRAAERAAALHADDSADRYYAALVSRLDADGVGFEQTVTPRIAWAQVLIRRTRYAAADRLLRQVLDQVHVDHPDRGRAAIVLAEVLGREGHPQEGIDLLDAEVELADAPVSVLAADGYLARAVLRFALGQYDEGLGAADKAIAAAAGIDEAARVGVVGQAEQVRAACLLLGHRHADARLAAERALDAGEQSGDLALQTKALSTLREIAMLAGRLADAMVFARRSHAVAEHLGDPAGLSFERANLGMLQLTLGDSESARRTARSALATARAYDAAWCLPYALLCLGEVELWTGSLERPDLAERLLTEAEEVAAGQGNTPAAAAARILLARLDVQRGHPRVALARLSDPPGLEQEAPSTVPAVRASALLATVRPRPPARSPEPRCRRLAPLKTGRAKPRLG